MTDSNVSSDKNDDPSSSTVETFTFRVEPTSVPVFITKLCTILDDISIQEMISWSKDGERFCVFDIPGFSKVVLPRYFKHSNWPSFVRQLNMYGFHKINDSCSTTHGQLVCEFHHPMFYRNGRQSLRKIRRNSRRSSSSTTVESYPQQQSSQHIPTVHRPPQRHHHNRSQQTSFIRESIPPTDNTTVSSSSFFQTSSMPISSLLISNRTDYTDNEASPFYDSTRNNNTRSDNDEEEDSGGRDIWTDHSSDDDWRMDEDKLSFTGCSNANPRRRVRRPDHENKHNSVNDNSTNTNTDDLCNEGGNLSTDKVEAYITLKRYLDQLHTKILHLNGEVSVLKQDVAKQQQSVLDLLNYLGSVTGTSDNLVLQKLQNPVNLSPERALSKLDEASSSGNNRDHVNLDGNTHSCGHYYHHDRKNDAYQGSPSRAQDGMVDSSDINTIKKGIWDILKESKQVTGMAKKDHHMHLNSITDKGVRILPLSTPLGHNNNNNNNNKEDFQTAPTLLPASRSSTIPDP